MHVRTLGAAALTTALVLLPTAAHTGGSDSPTPFTVTAEGLTLPAGSTFERNGHINYRVSALDGSGTRTFNVHQSDPHNGQWPHLAYVGQSFYAWADHPQFAAAFPDGYCVTWVQVSLYDEHFGEGGQAPVCSVPTIPVAPEPTPPVAPEIPDIPEIPEVPEVPDTPEVPEIPVVVEPEPTPPVTPEAPEIPEIPVIPEVPVTPEIPVVPEPTPPVAPEAPDTAEIPRTDVLATEPPVISEVLAAPDGHTALASTGFPLGPVAALGVATLVGGASLVAVARRSATDDEH